MIIETKVKNRRLSAGGDNKSRDLHFINVIKFISMIGIISIHTLILPKGVELNQFLHQIEYPCLYIVTLNLLRFSVISFCIISGYLIDSKMENGKIKFYKRRLKAILPPFLIAFLITAFLIYLKGIITSKPVEIVEILKELILSSSFWFIPSQLISILVLLLIIKNIKHIYTGMLLFLLLLIITVKYVYIHPIYHVNMVFSLVFVFYYWLGANIKRLNWIEKMERISLLLILVIWVGCFALVNVETLALWKSDYPGILNNLRLSNQLYSIVSFVLLVRISKFFKDFSIVNPQTETLGIYLYHWIIVVFVSSGIIKFYPKSISFEASVGLSMLNFALSYILVTITVKTITKFNFFYLSKNKEKTFYVMKNPNFSSRSNSNILKSA